MRKFVFMETLIIDVPEKKSILVKQLLEELGVTIKSSSKSDITTYKQTLANIPVWTDEDLKVFEESKRAFEDLKPPQW